MYHYKLSQDDIASMTPGQTLDRFEDLQDMKREIAKATRGR